MYCANHCSSLKRLDINDNANIQDTMVCSFDLSLSSLHSLLHEASLSHEASLDKMVMQAQTQRKRTRIFLSRNDLPLQAASLS